MSRDDLTALRELHKEARSTFGVFLSHCKADAEGAARALKDYLTKELAQPIFLDSDDLKDLGELENHVRNSQVADRRPDPHMQPACPAQACEPAAR